MDSLKIKESFLKNISSTNETVDNDKGWMNIISSVQSQTNALSSKNNEQSNTYRDDHIRQNVLNHNYYLKNAVESNLLKLNLKQCKNCHKPFKLHDYNEHKEFCEDTITWIRKNNPNQKPPKKRRANAKLDTSLIDPDVDISKLSPYKKRKLLQQQQEQKELMASPLKNETSTSDALAKNEKKPIKVLYHALHEDLDLDRQCGVAIHNKEGYYCSKPLNCKAHSLPLKKQVEGRTQSYETCLHHYQKEMKLMKQKLSKGETPDALSLVEQRELLKEQKLNEKKEKLLKKQEERAIVKRMKQEEKLKLQQLRKHERQLKQNEENTLENNKTMSIDADTLESKNSNKNNSGNANNKNTAQVLLRQQLKKSGKFKKFTKEEENIAVMAGFSKSLPLALDSFDFTSTKHQTRKFRFKQALYSGLNNNTISNNLNPKEKSIQALSTPVFGSIFGRVGLVDVNFPNEKLFSENYDAKKVKLIQQHQMMQEQTKREALEKQAAQQTPKVITSASPLTPKSGQILNKANSQSTSTVTNGTPLSQKLISPNGQTLKSPTPIVNGGNGKPSLTVEQLPQLEHHYKGIFAKYQALYGEHQHSMTSDIQQQLTTMKQHMTKLQPIIKKLRLEKNLQDEKTAIVDPKINSTTV
ncbi:uncharacterized protein HGUI_02644 [Hanseniaspora guilliermondii]|uniref:SCA7 domain-containing protein n=1 Tax=Hanseniaspora guilliermondii TaxID=56406 RepID=A0A1L0B3T1_9ASCO|nr:uncharacterized protein HGUI_02644 [Hanseniaspora guilliermondii]